jgi:hypothetical protein
MDGTAAERRTRASQAPRGNMMMDAHTRTTREKTTTDKSDRHLCQQALWVRWRTRPVLTDTVVQLVLTRHACGARQEKNMLGRARTLLPSTSASEAPRVRPRVAHDRGGRSRQGRGTRHSDGRATLFWLVVPYDPLSLGLKKGGQKALGCETNAAPGRPRPRPGLWGRRASSTRPPVGERRHPGVVPQGGPGSLIGNRRSPSSVRRRAAPDDLRA